MFSIYDVLSRSPCAIHDVEVLILCRTFSSRICSLYMMFSLGHHVPFMTSRHWFSAVHGKYTYPHTPPSQAVVLMGLNFCAYDGVPLYYVQYYCYYFCIVLTGLNFFIYNGLNFCVSDRVALYYEKYYYYYFYLQLKKRYWK